MKIRFSLVSNSSSSSFIVCNLDLLNINDIDISHDEDFLVNYAVLEDTRSRIVEILAELKQNGSYSTNVGYSDDSVAFCCIRNHISKNSKKFYLYELEGAADRESYIISISEEQIRQKRL